MKSKFILLILVFVSFIISHKIFGSNWFKLKNEALIFKRNEKFRRKYV